MTNFEILTLSLIIYFFLSIITFFVYAVDKRRAMKDKWRIPEKTLLIMPWFLGSLGGLWGLYGLRHKTQHWYFVINNILAFVIHVLIFIIIGFCF